MAERAAEMAHPLKARLASKHNIRQRGARLKDKLPQQAQEDPTKGLLAFAWYARQVMWYVLTSFLLTSL